MKGSEIRTAFLTFFEKRGHARLPSASLLPKDKTLLFNIAGMVPFKPYFLGEVTPPHARATTSQKCIRTNDIERVGTTARHLTFFEMLGNFSFGDYFKKEAIGWGWEFLTSVVGLSKDRLTASVYTEDDESFELWKTVARLPDDRIVRLGKADNFWEVGPTGPCGPCSEILYDQGKSFSCGKPTCGPGCDCDRYLEVWNLVFMQYNQSDGKLQPLPKKNIDTGMGLERIAAVVQGRKSNFETDLIYPLIEAAEQVTGRRYTDDKLKVAFNIIADHTRAVTFLLADGARPSNEDRGYVVRRLIRRAAAALHKLGRSGPGLHQLVPKVVEMFSNPYAELARERETIAREFLLEEERFAKTLEVGMQRLTDAIGKLRREKGAVLPGGEAFVLFDTYGFPLELTKEILAEEKLSVDLAGFEREMDAQKSRARAAWDASRGGLETVFVSVSQPTVFVGYETLESDARVVKIAKGGVFVDAASAGESVDILFDRTPFYAERGGQVGDAGAGRSKIAEFRIETCVPAGVSYVHRAEIQKGELRPGDAVRLTVDCARRSAIMKNHTATHLLHAALRNIVGDGVHQSGSLVAPDQLRFDFTAPAALGPKLSEVERWVNEQVIANLPVSTEEMSLDAARKTGAMMLFDEKYGDKVRVVSVGAGRSVELCGGTHSRSTGEIGFFKIVSESAISAGNRRIVAVTGLGAVDYVQDMSSRVRATESALKVSLSDAPALIEKIQKEKRDLEKKLKEARRGGAGGPSVEDVLAKLENLGELSFIVAEVPDSDLETLRGLAERLRDKIAGPVVLGTREGTAAHLVMASPKTLADKFNAGKIIAQIAPLVGGRGGGRPDFAQAGGKTGENLSDALAAARHLISG